MAPELPSCMEIHRCFTELSLSGADADVVVAQAAAFAGGPVLLEDTAHRVLAFAPPSADAQAVLVQWRALSRRIVTPGPTSYDERTGWLTTVVGAGGQFWGRLLVRCAQPSDSYVLLAERAAAVIALDRLLRQDEDPAHRAQRGLLTALLAGNLPAAQFATRAEVLGVPVAEGALIGVAVRGRPRAVGDALRDTGQPALFGSVADGSVAILLALASGEDGHDQVTKLAAAVRNRVGPDVVIGAGRVVTAVHDARQSLTEALRVAAVATSTGGRSYVRPADVGLPALMMSLRDDHDLQAYVERELGPLLAHTAENPGSDLLGTLRSYLDSGGNKSDAAAAAHMSRQALYDRLKRIGQLLDADLDSPRARAALHIAVLGHDAIHPGHS